MDDGSGIGPTEAAAASDKLADKPAIEASNRFDTEFYRCTYRGSMPPDRAPLDHFLEVGCALGYLASPSFDPIVYKIRHPGRANPNPLVDAAVNGDHTDHRDIAALFWDIDVGAIRRDMTYPRDLESQWSAHSEIIVQNIDRSVRLSWPGGRYELRNPHPQEVLARLRHGRPFALARLPHAMWDVLFVIRRLAALLRNDPRCRSLSDHEVKTTAIRLFARQNLGNDFSIENFCHEFENDLSGNPKDADFWTAISLRGAPTFDDGMYGLDPAEVGDRLAIVGGFFGPDEVLYDATMWKRWALSGDLSRLAEEARSHPIIAVGPGKLESLGRKWGLPDFHHVAIGPVASHVIRYELLDRTSDIIAETIAAPPRMKPIVLFQSGTLAYWMIRRLRERHRDVFYLDLGQALDLWYWNEQTPWMRIYGDVLRAANPLAVSPSDEAEPPKAAPGDPVGRAAEIAARVTTVLQRDYIGTGFMAPLPTGRLCPLAGPFRKVGAWGWVAKLPPELKNLCDDSGHPRRSRLVLTENGAPLGEGHDLHEAIWNEGGGRYSFWSGALYFSTSDGSDPAANGRRYWIESLDLYAEPLAGDRSASDSGPAASASQANGGDRTPGGLLASELLPLFGPAAPRVIKGFTDLLDVGDNTAPPPFRNVRQKFVIGFTARTGSTLLCEHLFRYGVAVAEYLNPTHIGTGAYNNRARDYHALCGQLVDQYTAGSAWGVKAHLASLVPLFLIGEFPERLSEWRFVHLSRENIVRQAISIVIVRKTQAWASWQEPQQRVGDDDYSGDAIRRVLQDVVVEQERWEKFFARYGIEPLRLTYEQIAADPSGAADRVAAFCGLTPGGEVAVERFKQPPLQRQGGALNVAWEERFRREGC